MHKFGDLGAKDTENISNKKIFKSRARDAHLGTRDTNNAKQGQRRNSPDHIIVKH